MLRSFFTKYKANILAIFLLSFTTPLFFYRLGQSSLVSWDEAWYAEIARNILKTGDFLNLMWNGRPYYDHPPAGFWLMALAFKVFGVSEFWARFAPAMSGLASLFIMYFLGKEFFNRVVGFVSALALSSSLWFLYRARSGNLDTILTMFFLLTLFLALKATKNKNFLIPFAVSLAFLFLTKTLVPLTIFPSLILIFWKSKSLSLRGLWLPAAVFFVIVGGWFMAQLINQSNFLERYLMIGFPGAEAKSDYLANLSLFKEYLHNGIGKWFWPGMAAIILGLFLRKKPFFILAAFFFTFALPFIFSHKGHIWHLIPLHPILILALFGFLYTVSEKVLKNRVITAALILLGGFYFSFVQIRQIWYQFIDIPAYVSDEAILSREAGRYTQDFYIDGDFGPAAVFYSGKNVSGIWTGGLPSLFAEKNGFSLITYQWRLDSTGISKEQYRIIKADRDKILIRKD